MLPKVLLSEDINESGKAILDGKAQIIIAPDTSESTAMELVKDAIGMILRVTTQITRSVINNAPGLKIISRTGVGVDNVDVAAASEKGIYVCNFPGLNNVTVAEHSVAMIMALSKQVIHMHDSVKSGNWKERFSELQMEVGQKKLGIIGMGQIGSMVAKMAYYGLGMKVLAYDPYVRSASDLDNVIFADQISDLFKNADFISVHVPNIPETKGIVSREMLGLMKQSAYLINTSRGATIDEQALIEVLRNKKIRGAALDVFLHEPLPLDNALINLENVILSPHCAGSTWESNVRISVAAAQSVLDIIEGRRPAPQYIYNLNLIS